MRSKLRKVQSPILGSQSTYQWFEVEFIKYGIVMRIYLAFHQQLHHPGLIMTAFYHEPVHAFCMPQKVHALCNYTMEQKFHQPVAFHRWMGEWRSEVFLFSPIPRDISSLLMSLPSYMVFFPASPVRKCLPLGDSRLHFTAPLDGTMGHGWAPFLDIEVAQAQSYASTIMNIQRVCDMHWKPVIMSNGIARMEMMGEMMKCGSGRRKASTLVIFLPPFLHPTHRHIHRCGLLRCMTKKLCQSQNGDYIPHIPKYLNQRDDFSLEKFYIQWWNSQIPRTNDCHSGDNSTPPANKLDAMCPCVLSI